MSVESIYAIGSVLLISLVSLVGLAAVALSKTRLEKVTFMLVGVAAGAMLGNAVIHLLPEAFEAAGHAHAHGHGHGHGQGVEVSLLVIGGIFLFFILEKVLQWHHCHSLNQCHQPGHCKGSEHVHPVGYMSLAADALENFVDGMIVASAYLVNIEVGIATTLAVILHEIPSELGDFGVLLHAGFGRAKALVANFCSGLVAVAGAVVALFLSGHVENFAHVMTPVAAGAFIYIALSDLVPQLHKEVRPGRSCLQLLAMSVGVGLMLLLAFME